VGTGFSHSFIIFFNFSRVNQFDSCLKLIEFQFETFYFDSNLNFTLYTKFFCVVQLSICLMVNPSTAFGHSDRKKRVIQVFCDAFCKTFIQLLSVNSRQIWVTVAAFCKLFRKYFETSLKSFL
jgi:hypothetical protein